MKSHRTTIRPVAVLLLGLCLALPGGPAGAAQSSEAMVSTPSTGATLRLSDGRVFGEIEERPLAEVLDFFAEATGLDYKVPDDLRGHPVSARLDGLTLNEALEDLLRPFDYMASFTAEGLVGGVRVRGLRSGYAAPAAAKNRVRPEASGKRARLEPATDRASQAENDFFELPIPDEPIYAEDWLEDLDNGDVNHVEMLEMAKHLDPYELADAIGVPVEQLYMAPVREGADPQLNINWILVHLFAKQTPGN